MSLNPLLHPPLLPSYGNLLPEHIEPAITEVLAQNRTALAALKRSQQGSPTWEGVIKPLEDMGQKLLGVLQVVGPLSRAGVLPQLSAAYAAAQPLIAAYQREVDDDPQLQALITQLQACPDPAWNATQRAAVAEWVAAPERAASGLAGESLAQYRLARKALDDCLARFAQHVEQAKDQWGKHIEQESLLAGLSRSDKAVLAQAARQRGKTGWWLTLDLPVYLMIMKYAEQRPLREEMYFAYWTQASDRGPQAGEHDNGPLIDEILAQRQVLARLLGYRDHAAVAAVSQTLPLQGDVGEWLMALSEQLIPAVESEIKALAHLGQSLHEVELQAWDLAFYKEQYRQRHYRLSDEVRDYFPIETVMKGLRRLMRTLFGVRFKTVAGYQGWDRQVRALAVHDGDTLLGHLLIDVFGREGKRSGVWMEGLRDRHRNASGELQLPMACIFANFSPPVAGQRTLLTLAQVDELMHELGHAMQHLLTEIDHGSVSGIKGVPQDIWEFPASVFEHWGHHEQSLAMLSGHQHTGLPIAPALLQDIVRSRRHMAAYDALEQVLFACTDHVLHSTAQPRPYDLFDEVYGGMAVLPPPAATRPLNTFLHLFATDDYAAGYHAYVWSKVLAAQAFARFLGNGVLDADTARDFRNKILAPGGTQPMLAQMAAFCGGPPDTAAYLEALGL